MRNVKDVLSCNPESEEVSPPSTDFIRPIGGYEKLLSRKIPDSSSVALSHGAVYVLAGDIDTSIFTKAIILCVEKHPMLRSYIKINKDATENPITGPELVWVDYAGDNQEIVDVAVTYLQEQDDTIELSWKREMERAMNGPQFPSLGPLWYLKVLITPRKSALVFCVNHGLDDQQSLNILVSDTLSFYDCLLRDEKIHTTPIPFPPSVEAAVSPECPGVATLDWSLFQIGNSASGSLKVPERVTKDLTRIDPVIRETQEFLNKKYSVDSRKTIVDYFQISEEKLKRIREICKSRNLTITHFLSAIMIFVTDQVILGHKSMDEKLDRKLRLLLSVGLRTYGKGMGEKDWTRGTVACAGGALDFVVPLKGANFLETGELNSCIGPPQSFWRTAEFCRDTTKDLMKRGFVEESVRLFGIGMKYADILKVVEIAATSSSGLGREYSCGLSNVGVVTFPEPLLQSGNDTMQQLPRDEKAGMFARFNPFMEGLGSDVSKLSTRKRLKLVKAYYGTSHARNGVVCQLSCQTINSQLFGCLQFPFPILTRVDAIHCRQKVEEIVDSIV